MKSAAQTKRYTAKVVRFGDWWAIDVPEILGVHTQAKKLEDVADMARDAIAMALDVAPASFSVEIDTRLDQETARLVQEAQRAREDAIRAQAHATRTLSATIQHVSARGISVRDAGHLLGLSYQRVAQIRGGVAEKAAKYGAAKDDKRSRKGRITTT